MLSTILSIVTALVAIAVPTSVPETAWYENREWLCQGSVYVTPEQAQEYAYVVETGDYIGSRMSTLGPEDSDLVSRALFAHMVSTGQVEPC